MSLRNGSKKGSSTDLRQYGSMLSLGSNDRDDLMLPDPEPGTKAGKTDDRHKYDPNDESSAEFKQRWISLGIAFVVQFLLMLQNSIFWSSLWPFLSTIDKTADETFFGFVMMAFPLASAISSPLFGWWTNRIQECRKPIIGGIVISVLGNLLLACVEAFTDNRKWIILVARFISGFGCGNYGSLYAYIVMASKVEERSRAISIRASLNSVALMLGPALQTAFVPIGFPGFVAGRFHLDLYTATAWANVIAGILQILIMIFLFKEFWISVDQSQMKAKDGTPLAQKTLKPYDKFACFVCIWIRFCYQFCITFDGTIGSPFTILMFGWTATEAVLYNGIIQIVTSCIDLAGNLIMGNIVLRYVEERKTIIVGLTFAILFFVTNFSWPGLPPLIPEGSVDSFIANNQSITSAALATTTAPLNSSIVVSAETGCKYVWCSYTTRVYFWQFLLAKLFVTLSISIGYTPNATIFSKVLGPRKQGTLQGVFAAAGQASMTLSPLVSSTLWQNFGPRVVYGTAAVVLSTGVLALILGYKRLVPWKDYEDDEDAQGGGNEKTPLLAAEGGAVGKIETQSSYGSQKQDSLKDNI